MNTSSQDQSTTAGAAQGTAALRPASAKPGPWRVVGYFIEGPDGETIARVERHGSEEHPHNPHWLSDAMTEQDATRARLISAAPELLEALQAMVEAECDYMRINHLGAPDNQHNIRLARAAIRKALSDGSEARTGGEEG